MSDIVITSVDDCSKCFLSKYAAAAAAQQPSMKVVVLEDVTHRATRDLLDALGVTMFPAVIKGGVVSCGSAAFAVMHAMTGMTGMTLAESTGENAKVGGTSVHGLKEKQARDRVIRRLTQPLV